MKAPLRIGRFPLGGPTLVFVAVILVRLISLARFAGSSLLLPSHGDMHFYNDWALRILRGGIGGNLAFYGLPGYAYMLAITYKGFGYNPFVPGFFQAALDSGTAVLIYLLTLQILRQSSALREENAERKFTSQLFSITAALGWAFFVPAAAYSVVLMPTAWFVFVFWLVVWRITRNTNAPQVTESCLFGIIIGVTATAVANILLLVPFVLAAVVFKPRQRENGRWRSLLSAAAALFLGAVIGTAPCWVHNYIVARDPVFLSAHSGINFWIGNNPIANGYPRFPPGLRAGQAAMLQDSITQAESIAGHSLKRAEVSAYWSAKAKNYITHQFGDWVKLLARKLFNFWNAFQYDDLSIITNLREQDIVPPGLYFGVVAALAMPGIIFGWRFAPPSRWVIAATLLSMFALLPVFITERYRLVAVPGLLVLAVVGLGVFWQSLRTGQIHSRALYLVLLIGSTIFIAWPQKNPSLRALDAYNSGWQAFESNKLDLAEKKLAIAHAYVPDNTETLFALGNLRLGEQKSEDAASFYRAVLAIDPNHKGAFNNLGVIALEANRYEEAENWLRLAENVDPRNAKTHFLLAKTLLAKGDRRGAHAHIELAIQLDPDQAEFKQFSEQIDEHDH